MLLKNVNIIDCKNIKSNVYKGSILIKDKKIKKIFKNNRPQNINELTVDLNENYLLPGIIDAHVHLGIDGRGSPWYQLNQSQEVQFLRVLKNANKSLQNGVTMVRDMGDNKDVVWKLKKHIKTCKVIVPSIKFAGKWLTVKGGHGSQVGHILSKRNIKDRCEDIIKEKKKKGINIIKVMLTGGLISNSVKQCQFTLYELKNIVSLAHHYNMFVSTHVQSRQGLKLAIEAGVDSIEHGVPLNKNLAKLIKEKNIFLIPTISGPYYMKEYGVNNGLSKEKVKKIRNMWPKIIHSFQLAMKHNIKIIMGTDASTPGNFHGNNLNELVLMVKLGMAPYKSILSATNYSSKMLGISDKYGTIEEGKYADMIILEKNPLTEITSVIDPIMVIKNGQIVSTN